MGIIGLVAVLAAMPSQAATEPTCIAQGSTRGVAIVDAHTVLFDTGASTYLVRLARECTNLLLNPSLSLGSNHDDHLWCARSGDQLLVGGVGCDLASIQPIERALYERTVTALKAPPPTADATPAHTESAADEASPTQLPVNSSASCFSPGRVQRYSEQPDGSLLVQVRGRKRYKVTLQSRCVRLADLPNAAFVAAAGGLICGRAGDHVVLSPAGLGTAALSQTNFADGDSCPIAKVERVE